jgi:hypothetical protein
MSVDRRKIIEKALRHRLERDPFISNDKIPQIIRHAQELLTVRILPNGQWGVRESDIQKYIADIRLRPGFQSAEASTPRKTAEERLAEANRASDKENQSSVDEVTDEEPVDNEGVAAIDRLKKHYRSTQSMTTDARGFVVPFKP